MVMKKIVVIAICIIFQACDDKLDVNITKTQLVVSCAFSGKSVVNIELSKSKSVWDTTFGNNNPAPLSKISLFENGTLKEVMQNAGSNIYKSVSIPVPENTYSIEIESENYPIIKASDKIPYPAKILNIDTSIIENSLYPSNEEIKQLLHIEIDFKDKEFENNYYRILADSDLFMVIGPDTFSNLIPIQLKNNNFSTDITHNAFNDKLFDGERITVGFDILITEAILNAGYIKILLYTLSESYYKGLYFATKQADSNVNNDYYSIPVQSYSNIKNGLGVFVAYSIDEYYIDISNLK